MQFTQPFRGVPQGAIYPVDYQPGDECPPNLEAAAREAHAVEDAKSAPKAKAKQ